MFGGGAQHDAKKPEKMPSFTAKISEIPPNSFAHLLALKAKSVFLIFGAILVCFWVSTSQRQQPIGPSKAQSRF